MKILFPHHSVCEPKLDFCFVRDPTRELVTDVSFKPEMFRMTHGPDPARVFLYVFEIEGVDQLVRDRGQPLTMADIDAAAARNGRIVFDTVQASSLIVIAGCIDLPTAQEVCFELEGEEVTL